MFRERGHVRLPYKEWRRSQQARHLWQHSATLVRHTQQNCKLVYNLVFSPLGSGSSVGG